MENVLKGKIEALHKDFVELNNISKGKNEDIIKYKKEFSSDLSLDKHVQNFSNLVADFTLITRDSQIVFTELFSMIKLYRDLNFEGLSDEIVEFYNTNEKFLPKTLFVIKEGGIVEKEEGSLQKERDTFLKSDYLKSLINLKN